MVLSVGDRNAEGSLSVGDRNAEFRLLALRVGDCNAKAVSDVRGRLGDKAQCVHSLPVVASPHRDTGKTGNRLAREKCAVPRLHAVEPSLSLTTGLAGKHAILRARSSRPGTKQLVGTDCIQGQSRNSEHGSQTYCN